MNLKIEHLAPYLPNVIECITEDGFRGILMQLALKENDHDLQVKINDGNNFQWRYVEGIKPLLRPLSDLTNEIEYNGNKFVPIEILNEDFGKIELNVTNNNESFFVNFETFKKFDDLYRIYDMLFEWHFDVFGLIDKGLAIDINTHE